MQYLVRSDCLSTGKVGKRENGEVRSSTAPRFNAANVLAACLLLAAGISGRCQEAHDPLLDLMIQKGMLTQEEASKVKAEADAIRTNGLSQAMPPAESKWRISKAVKDLELFGDVRLRTIPNP